MGATSEAKAKRSAGRRRGGGTARGSGGAARAPGTIDWLVVRGARQNNLRGIDAAFPLGRFICVTGVSGSGKSSLVNDILHQALARELNGALTAEPGDHDAVEGLTNLDKVIAIDQTPIGRTPRSNPATYIKVFDEIRALYTKLPDAKLRGYKPGRFSFNVSVRKGGGRCEACEGNGANRLEMDFLADVWVKCSVCEGHRFGRETLQILYKHKSIADVLEMDVQEALAHFDNVPRIKDMLQTLHDVGVDYVKLGQPSPTLSGGEAQRIKLARELVRKSTGRTLYVLDEPTTGLHFEDIRKLLAVLHGFVDAGNTVVVIEHNLDVVKTADWVIDLGPEGGEAGGRIVATGTPEDVAGNPASYTGQALAEVLAPKRRSRGARRSRPATTRAASATARDFITVTGARQHNLRDLTVRVPRDRTTVCTGVSGSGKTSFAIDTVFTEGYRRYVESLSAYARQFLGQMAKPRVDHVEGLSPAICIEQKAPGRSPRSTVGTITEIYDYMRVLWARAGVPHCPQCHVPIGAQTVDEIVDRMMRLPRAGPEGESADASGAAPDDPGAPATPLPIIILAPVMLGDGETWGQLFTRLKNSGYRRVRIDGEVQVAAQATTLDARQRHRVEVVVDRTTIRDSNRGRIAESVEHALTLGDGRMTLLIEAVETVEEDADDASHAGAPESASDNDRATNGDTVQESPVRPVRTRQTEEREILFSSKLACTRCGSSYEELSPHHFSFNSQLGWCDGCEGLGVQRGAPASAIVSEPSRTLFDGAIAGWGSVRRDSPLGAQLAALCEHLGVDPKAPLADWSPAQQKRLLFGTDEWLEVGGRLGGFRTQWRGFLPTIDAATRNSWMLRHRLHNVVTDVPCVTCRGGRLRSEAAAVRLAGRTIVETCDLPLREALAFFESGALERLPREVVGELLQEIRNRLRFLVDVGLDYLHLHRAAPTLSGGEAQRIRLASQIGSGLSGVLYVLDEPTIGLHPRDNGRLIAALRKLRDLGNTLLVVEHDRDVIRSADRLLDFGPRAGREGGRVVAEGTPAGFLNGDGADGRGRRGSKKANAKAKQNDAGVSAVEEGSLTRQYLSGMAAVGVPENRRPVDAEGWRTALRSADKAGSEKVRRRRGRKRDDAPRRGPAPATVHDPDAAIPGWLIVRGARENNLRQIDVPIPLARFVCVTGVSGSGKSSLVDDILGPALAERLQLSSQRVGAHAGVVGAEQLDKVIVVDQSPIGTTPASNPATYTGVFDDIRELFARLPDSKVRGYEPKRFSFNRPGGRCEVCEGNGQIRIEMHFMPDVWVECEECKGRRYNPETLEVRFKDRNIAEVLDMRVAEALTLFDSVPRVRRMLRTLADVGLDYVQLGQPAPTLSGGEAQRVKLAAELGKPDTGRTFYILDEPTTGLHFDDVRKLLNVVHRLVDLGNTALVVEHNLDVIKSADWVIDLGPEAGEGGGRLVALGTPEDVAAVAESHTGTALAPILAGGPCERRTRYDAAKHAEAELEVAKAGFGDVGKEARMPWQVDGRRWHLEQRDDRNGKERKWEPGALEYVLDLVQKAGGFEETNWNNRASVEVTAPGAPTWFLHALTGGEWLLELYFRAPPGTFDWQKLDAELGLPTLDERDDLQAYGDWARVDVRPRRDELDAVVVYPHDRKEVDTPAFRRFVRKAAKAYLKWAKQQG